MPRVIALTGATGFIGKALMKRLVSAGLQVRALCRQRRRTGNFKASNIRWVRGRLEDPESLSELLRGADTVIHCAGRVRGSEWRQFKKVNTDGVARLVQVAMQMHPSPRFLLLSSLAAREPHLSHYAASKRGGEKILEANGHQLSWIALRPPAVYGPGDREMTPLFRLMCKGLAPQATANGSRFSMLYIDDLTAAIIALVEKGGWGGSILELHDGRPGGYEWCEVAQTVSRITTKPVFSFKLPRFMIRSAAVANIMGARLWGYAPMLSPGKVRELEHPDWTCDNAAIFSQTGWQPHTGLEEGIKKTLVFMGVISDKPDRRTRGARYGDI